MLEVEPLGDLVESLLTNESKVMMISKGGETGIYLPLRCGYATFNSIQKVSGANIHDYPGTSKKTLDGLLYLVGDLLDWYYNDIMKNPELYDNEVN